MHHIVDPRTSRPTGGPWRTVSVAAESALEANVCSTAAIVLGDRAPSWLASQGVAARLVDLDGRVTTLGGWPSERTIAALEHAASEHAASQHAASQHAASEHAASEHAASQRIPAGLMAARTSVGAR
jgi:ApbE family